MTSICLDRDKEESKSNDGVYRVCFDNEKGVEVNNKVRRRELERLESNVHRVLVLDESSKGRGR